LGVFILLKNFGSVEEAVECDCVAPEPDGKVKTPGAPCQASQDILRKKRACIHCLGNPLPPLAGFEKLYPVDTDGATFCKPFRHFGPADSS